MAEKDQNQTVTDKELVADDPGLTSPPTQIVLESTNPVQPSIVDEAKKKEEEKKNK